MATLLCTVTVLFVAAAAGVRGLREGAGVYQRLTFLLLVIWLMLPG